MESKSQGRSAEPIDTVFLTQASNEPIELDLLNERMLLFSFKLNCLFFDSIAVPASGLLANPMMLRLARSEADALQELYRHEDRGGAGVLRPILPSTNRNILDVAEEMLQRGTIHSLKTPGELEEHAESIHRADPHTLDWDEDLFRSSYYNHMLELVECVNTEGSPVGTQPGLPAGAVKPLVEWLQTNADPAGLRCTDIFRFIDGHLDPKFGKTAKIMASALYQYAAQQGQRATFCAIEEYTPFVDRLICLSTPSTLLGTSEKSTSEDRIEDASVSLPLAEILRLGLRHLVEIRKLAPFRDARTRLAQYRAGWPGTTLDDVANALNTCSPLFYDYFRHHKLERLRRLARAPRYKLYAILAQGAAPLCLWIMDVTPEQARLLAMLICSCVGAFQYNLLKKLPPSGMFIETPGTPVHYDPVTGRTPPPASDAASTGPRPGVTSRDRA